MHSAREREKGEFAKNNVQMTSSGRAFHKALLRGASKGGKKEQGNVPDYELGSEIGRVSISDRHQKSADPLLMPSQHSEGRGTIESEHVRESLNDDVVLEADEFVVASPPVISAQETIFSQVKPEAKAEDKGESNPRTPQAVIKAEEPESREDGVAALEEEE